jgi:protein tyrosine/serine phosphatase
VLRRQSVPGIEARLGRTLDEEGIRALLEVHGDYLDRFHAIVNESYGSLDAWLEAEIGVDDALREALRERYLT